RGVRRDLARPARRAHVHRGRDPGGAVVLVPPLDPAPVPRPALDVVGAAPAPVAPVLAVAAPLALAQLAAAALAPVALAAAALAVAAAPEAGPRGGSRAA